MSERDLMRQAARAMGKKGGSSVSPRKAAAARRNGRLGGRPRKADQGIDHKKILWSR